MRSLWNNKKAYVPLIDNHLTSSLYRLNLKENKIPCLRHFSPSISMCLLYENYDLSFLLGMWNISWSVHIWNDRVSSHSNFRSTTESKLNNEKERNKRLDSNRTMQRSHFRSHQKYVGPLDCFIYCCEQCFSKLTAINSILLRNSHFITIFNSFFRFTNSYV